MAHLEILEEAPTAILYLVVLPYGQSHHTAAAKLQLLKKALQEGTPGSFLHQHWE